MRPSRLVPLLAAAVAALAPLHASAQYIARDEGFMKPPSSVQGRKHSLDGKNDLGLFFSLSIKNQLTEHYGFMLNYDKQLGEYWAIDVLGGVGLNTVAGGGLTSLSDKLRDQVKPTTSTIADDLADAGSLLATLQGGLRFTPIYGKMNLSAEFPVHFNAYLVAGAGGAFVRYDSILACNKVNRNASKLCPGQVLGQSAAAGVFRSETLPTLGVNVGGGFRFYVYDKWSLRVEIRDVFFPDRFYEKVNLANPGSVPGTLSTNAGITHTPLIMLGAGFVL